MSDKSLAKLRGRMPSGAPSRAAALAAEGALRVDIRAADDIAPGQAGGLGSLAMVLSSTAAACR